MEENVKAMETEMETEEVQEAVVTEVAPKKKLLERKPVKVAIGVVTGLVSLAGAYLLGKNKGHKETMNAVEGYCVKVNLAGAEEPETSEEETE